MSTLLQFPKRKSSGSRYCHISTLLDSAKYYLLVQYDPDNARRILLFCATASLDQRVLMVPPEISDLIDGVDLIKLKITLMRGPSDAAPVR